MNEVILNIKPSVWMLIMAPLMVACNGSSSSEDGQEVDLKAGVYVGLTSSEGFERSFSDVLVGPGRRVAILESGFTNDANPILRTTIGIPGENGSNAYIRTNTLHEGSILGGERADELAGGTAEILYLDAIPLEIEIKVTFHSPVTPSLEVLPYIINAIRISPPLKGSQYRNESGVYTHDTAEGGFSIDKPGGYMASIVIDTDNTFSITDSRNCIFDGSIDERIDVEARIEMFNFTADASNCKDTEFDSGSSINSASFTGVGAFIANDTVLLIGHNGAVSIGFDGKR